jgi:hypothetical protein
MMEGGFGIQTVRPIKSIAEKPELIVASYCPDLFSTAPPVNHKQEINYKSHAACGLHELERVITYHLLYFVVVCATLLLTQKKRA